MGIDEDEDDIDGKGSIGDDDEEDDEDSDNPYYKWFTQYIVDINIIKMQYSVKVLT